MLNNFKHGKVNGPMEHSQGTLFLLLYKELLISNISNSLVVILPWRGSLSQEFMFTIGEFCFDRDR